MSHAFTHPLPWYIAGPLIGLVVPVLLLTGNKSFGVSSNFRHFCAAVVPCGVEFFKHDWKRQGLWNLVMLAGVFVGAMLAAWLAPPAAIALSPRAVADLQKIGIHDFSGFAPREIFTWSALASVRGFVSVVIGGFLVGFGTAYAGGCTSGHAIAGLADRQLASLVAVCAFFAGGLAATYLLLPLVLK
jgi:uncharacterized membrane protein YedE/YeeE